MSLVYCVYICQESNNRRIQEQGRDGELYWTHHWQKNISMPEMRSGKSSWRPADPHHPGSSSAGYYNDGISVVSSARDEVPSEYLESDYGRRYH
ncbi:Uncharacterized protein FKW44_000344 [Caligus rogercresseyi]|uniref:Uncharacterized protein n=1 Tax=Caligus rogercresseyi TaxID=217165 RepID=A0A7T8KH78_CALRO|nr:Uncharacterized protein FKW44_000344 [Caligus rogercresseyi]